MASNKSKEVIELNHPFPLEVDYKKKNYGKYLIDHNIGHLNVYSLNCFPPIGKCLNMTLYK